MLFLSKRSACSLETMCIGIMAAILPICASGANTNDPGDYPEQVRQYLQHMLSKGQQKYAFRTDYPGGFEGWQRQTRPVLRRLIGLDKISEQVGNHDFKVELGRIEDLGQYTRQRGLIETEPHVQIKFWLLKPKKGGPFPLAIFPHGHDSLHSRL